MFGFTESRLPSVIPEYDATVSGFGTSRKDPVRPSTTGLFISVHETVTDRRLTHLEDDSVEAVWVEIKLERNRPIRVAFLSRNPAEKEDWIDRFWTMMDAVSLDTTELLLFGDFNVHLMKHQNLWIEKTYTYNVSKIIDTPTRITSTSKALTDHRKAQHFL